MHLLKYIFILHHPLQICDVRDGLEHTEGPIITPPLESEQGRPFNPKDHILGKYQQGMSTFITNFWRQK